ncbi:MAG TPA: dihydroorotase, partial [Rikenellaceae bacterium]|nr:dihydroorotase [Rikenellaceae bacterium]
PELYTRLCIGEKVPVAKIINALTTSPRSAFRLKNVFEEGCAADITVIDTRKEFTIDSRNFLSKGHSTPFDGDKVYGKVTMTFKDGKLVWKDNN